LAIVNNINRSPLILMYRGYKLTDTIGIPTEHCLYDEEMMSLFLLIAIAVSLYDLHTHCIPNWATLPLLVTGLFLHWPGSVELWLVTWILLFAWAREWMGAGDVKLWLVLLWLLPKEFSSHVLLFVFASFFVTALLQILGRRLRRQPLTKTASPAAWRTIPFLLMCWYAH
jgi:Flp pilus assembly protein protease CpaA